MPPARLLPALMLVLGISLAAAGPVGRILGGAEAKPNLRPYMASVQVNGSHLCGGVLIAQQWVLSAAHCLPENKNSSILRVLLGAHSLTDPEPSKQYFSIRKEFPHPNYTSTNNHNDLVLLQLNETVILGPNVQIFPFQRKDEDIAAGTVCSVAGWGLISLTGRRPNKMYEVKVPVISRETCNKRDQYDNDITMNMLCAGAQRKDSCEGDSGGPLVCDGQAIGIVSAGNRKCGNLKKPGIYTRIGPYTPWIDAILEESRLEEERALHPLTKAPDVKLPAPLAVMPHPDTAYSVPE